MSSAAYQQLCERSREVYLLRSEDGSYFVGKDVGMEDLVFRFVNRDGMDLNPEDNPWQEIETVALTTPDLAAQAKKEGRFLGHADKRTGRVMIDPDDALERLAAVFEVQRGSQQAIAFRSEAFSSEAQDRRRGIIV